LAKLLLENQEKTKIFDKNLNFPIFSKNYRRLKFKTNDCLLPNLPKNFTVTIISAQKRPRSLISFKKFYIQSKIPQKTNFPFSTPNYSSSFTPIHLQSTPFKSRKYSHSNPINYHLIPVQCFKSTTLNTQKLGKQIRAFPVFGPCTMAFLRDWRRLGTN
jgi:hypothetical protein